MLKTKIETLKNNLHRIPQEFFAETAQRKYKVIWFLNRQKPSIEQRYDFDMERFGMTIDGRLIYGFDSGCSCPSPWSAADYGDDTYDVKTYKEFFMDDMPSFDSGWEVDAQQRIDDILLFLDENVTVDRLLKIENSEIRRAIMKRIGYHKVRDAAKVIQTDEFGELIEISGDRYVKVKDASTDREYLLYVAKHLNTAKAAVAWTFYLSEKEYQPLKQT